ncbi:hypothetical protein pipiens_003567 [Culex pipiens pipiens]|uniref:RRM domain-containing protein n=1 Tax=Culex pipiens pipiens TaxID=38569 RepID=A0ABD1CW05_CULPP
MFGRMSRPDGLILATFTDDGLVRMTALTAGIRRGAPSRGREAPAPIASPAAAKAKAPKESTKGKVLTVTVLRLVMDKETGRSKGFGYVQYVEADDAAKAMAQLEVTMAHLAGALVLAADGQKMSKRKKNYPDPMEVVHKYGAAALPWSR